MRERGAKVLRMQFEESIAGYDGSRSAAANREDVLRERAESAERELERCRRALESSRASHQFDRATLAEVRADRDSLAERLKLSAVHAIQLRRNWERASALLRLLTPEQVPALRDELDGK